MAFNHACLPGTHLRAVRVKLTTERATVSRPRVALKSIVCGGDGRHRNHVPIQVHVRKKECWPAASNLFHVLPSTSKGGSGSMVKLIFCRISEEVICGLH